MATSKILIVEDDEFLRSLTAKRLEKEGYSLAIAVDGQAAIDQVQVEKPNLILLDLLLPEVNGFDALAKIRSLAGFETVPVVVFSNLGQKEDIEKAKGLGANDFMVKANFTLDDVVAKVKTYLPA